MPKTAGKTETVRKRTSDAAGGPASKKHKSGNVKAELGPILKATTIGPLEESYCGFFGRSRRWSLIAPMAGVIVQKVTRKFEVYDSETSTEIMCGKKIDKYLKDAQGGSKAYATQLLYWEAWTVSQYGNVSDRGVDTFQLCGINKLSETNKSDKKLYAKDTTRGEYSITGEASFYPNDQPEKLLKEHGFRLDKEKKTVCGGLWYTFTDPRLSGPSKQVVKRTATVTWNSFSIDPRNWLSKVTWRQS